MGKYALLIGVGEYGEGLTSLPAAPRDVAAFAEVLQNPQMGGFDEVKPVINPSQAKMAREIELWFRGREPDDLVLLFFSGHGVKDERRELFFAACNTEKQRDSLIRATAISAQSIHDCIRRCKAKYQVIILDCCFSGSFGDQLARDDGEINLKEQLGAEGRVVLTATNEVGYAFEEKGADLSIYTRYLVEGIVSGAADEDEDGVITVEELHRFAGRKVEETSPAMSPKIITLKDEGYRIRLARSPKDDSKVKYRKEAELRVASGQFSIAAKRLLRLRRQELGISDTDADEIEAEVLKPFQEYQRKRQVYEETLQECLQAETKLSPNVIQDLMDFRDHLGLRPEDVSEIDQTGELSPSPSDNPSGYTSQPPTSSPPSNPTVDNPSPSPAFPSSQKAASSPSNTLPSAFVNYRQALEEFIISDVEGLRMIQEVNVGSTDSSTSKTQSSPPEKLDDDLSSERNVDYTRLRDCLKAQQWQEANQETKRVMLQVADCEKQSWLDSNAIDCFSITDLRTIDQLWVKYSNGRFGFSVQRKIFQQVNQQEREFIQAVHWTQASLKGGIFSEENRLNFSLEAPEGHLPIVFGGEHSWIFSAL